MPLTLEKPSVSRLDDYYNVVKEDRASVAMDSKQEGYLYQLPVRTILLDLNDLPDCSKIRLELQQWQPGVIVSASKGLHIEVNDPHKTFARVKAIDTDDVSIPIRNHPSLNNEDNSDYNHVFKFKENPDQTVVCRHIASQVLHYRALQQANPKLSNWKDYIRSMFFPGNVRNTFVSYEQHENFIHDMKNSDRSYAIEDPSKTGVLFSEIFKIYAAYVPRWKEQEFYAYMRFKPYEGNGHGVAVVLKVDKSQVPTVYKIKVYDPNRSRAILSYSTKSLHRLEDLGRDNFLPIHYDNMPLTQIFMMNKGWPQVLNKESLQLDHDIYRVEALPNVDNDYVVILDRSIEKTERTPNT